MDELDKLVIDLEKDLEKGKKLHYSHEILKANMGFGFLIAILSASIFLIVTSFFEYFDIRLGLRFLISIILFIIVLFAFLHEMRGLKNISKELKEALEYYKNELKLYKEAGKNLKYRKIINAIYKKKNET